MSVSFAGFAFKNVDSLEFMNFNFPKVHIFVKNYGIIVINMIKNTVKDLYL